jgi:hypothetical protein
MPVSVRRVRPTPPQADAVVCSGVAPFEARPPAYPWPMIPPTRPSRPHRRADTFAFGSGKAWRPLRLVLDDDALSTAESAEVLAFGHYPEVDLTRTAPDAVPRLEIQQPTEDFVPIHTVGNGVGVFWVWHAARLRARAQEIASESDIGEEDAYRALVFAAAAEEADAEGFVTNRAFLRAEHGGQHPPFYTPAEAMALIGLALRLHGNESIGADFADLRLSGSTYHFVLARELTHAGWRWFSGCVATSHATKDDTAINLGQAALERLQRVLQIRDRLHAQAKIPSTPTVGDELVFQFETLLLFLSATFDAAARVAHLVYFGGDYEEAGWRRGDWAKRLAAAEPQLAALVADGTRGGTVLKLISRMRNTIHGEALRTITLQSGGRPTENPVELGASDAAKTVTDIVCLGADPAAWGLREERGRTYLSAARYAESLLPHAVSLLNDLMAATAVERFPGGDQDKLMTAPANTPSPNPLDDMFSFEVRHRVRRLGGF